MRIIHLAAAAALLALPALAAAQQSRTVTVDGPLYEGSRTTTIDREAGTLSRDAELTRLRDGAVATRSYDRARTESGFTASGNATNFQGQSRSFQYEATRTDRGYRGQGSATGFDGRSYELNGALRRGPNGGFVRRQGVRNEDGQLVAGRRVAVRRGDNGGVVRRSQSFRAPRNRR